MAVVSIATKVLRTDGVTVTPDRIRVRVGLPWYRSLPWAGVDDIRVSLDDIPLGDPIAIDSRPPASRGTRQDYWSIQDWADVDFAPTPGIRAGCDVLARIRIALRIPGPLAPDGSPMLFAFDHSLAVRVGSEPSRSRND